MKVLSRPARALDRLFSLIKTRKYSQNEHRGLPLKEWNFQPLYHLTENPLFGSRNSVTPIGLKLSNLLSERKPSYKAVIFDKDGTLICFNTLWVPWARKVAEKICEHTKRDLSEGVYRILGVCSKTFRISPGLLAEGTRLQIVEALKELLLSNGFKSDHALSIIDRSILDWTFKAEHLSQIHDIKDMFTILRQHGVGIGICTSDCRASTIQALSELDVLHLTDAIKCGDDVDSKPKPDSYNAKLLCSELNVLPIETVMVGDTATDMSFGINSKFGMCIGVLSGVGERADLDAVWSKNNHVPESVPVFQVVPSVADVIPLVLPECPIQVRVNQFASPADCSKIQKSRRSLHDQEFKLIILDISGTLISIHPGWSIWAEELTNRLVEVTSKEVGDRFLEILGYSPQTRRTSGGLLAEGSMLHIKECLSYLLILAGYGVKKSVEIVDKVWLIPDITSNDVIPGVTEILKDLQSAGISIALNTSGSREVTDNLLASSELKDVVDMVISADEAGQQPKPLPHTVLRIIEKIGCAAHETMVVGDTPADMMSGKAANVGLTVGVLSGFSLVHNLLPYANILLPNITYLRHLVQDKPIAD